MLIDESSVDMGGGDVYGEATAYMFALEVDSCVHCDGLRRRWVNEDVLVVRDVGRSEEKGYFK